ncbi:ROK family protein [Nocardiopsis ansamitocini]|uniref:ROK family protein n=1 Tax=Nocardiopsis ansamitocini TaxID=1670832 RepID=UPI003D7F368D
MGVSEGPAGFQAIRETNLGIVLRTIREQAPCSRALVAGATGLTKATVSSIVADLIGRGLVRETGQQAERKVGRPGVMLTLDHQTLAAIGLEINVDYVSIVAVDLLEQELLTEHVEFDARAAGPEACARRLRDALLEVIGDPLMRRRALLGVSVAVPGLIDSASGTVTNAPNLDWHGFALRDRLSALLADAGHPGLALLVDNDANLGAIAEYRGGHLARTPDLVYITGEVGIGAGLLMDGRLLRGSGGFAGELGHIPLLKDGPACGCGRRGCLEALAGVDAVLRRALPDVLAPERTASIDVGAMVDLTVQRAEAGDPTVLEALEDAGTWLGRGAATLVNLLNPRAVVFGGYFVPLAPWLLPPCRAVLGAHVFAADSGGCRVDASALGLSAAARGGAMALVDALDTGALPLPPSRSAA